MFGREQRNKVYSEGYYLENGLENFDFWRGVIVENGWSL